MTGLSQSLHRSILGPGFGGRHHGMPGGLGSGTRTAPNDGITTTQDGRCCQSGAGGTTGFVRSRILSAEAAVWLTGKRCLAIGVKNQPAQSEANLISSFHLLAAVSVLQATDPRSCQDLAWPDRGPSGHNQQPCMPGDPNCGLLTIARHLSDRCFQGSNFVHPGGAAPCQPHPRSGGVYSFCTGLVSNTTHCGRLVVWQQSC